MSNAESCTQTYNTHIWILELKKKKLGSNILQFIHIVRVSILKTMYEKAARHIS